MNAKICTTAVLGFINKLNTLEVTCSEKVNSQLSLVVGNAIAAHHVSTNQCLVVDKEAFDDMTNLAYQVNDAFPINYDLAVARARDVINQAYNQIFSQGGTNDSHLKLETPDGECNIMCIDEATILFNALRDWFAETQEGL